MTDSIPAGGGRIVPVSRPLVVILVHGIGPQNAPAQQDFLNRLRQATAEHVARRGHAERMSRLVTERADWSHLFPERHAWLTTLFPSEARRKVRLQRILWMLFVAVVVPAIIIALGTAGGMVRVHPAAVGWLIGVAIGLAAALLAGWVIILPGFPWGHLWTFLRGFEADTASDVVLYGSDDPRRQILEVVLDKLGPHLQEKYALAPGMGECLPVLFIGHSLGTVVVYDLLLGISARMRGRTTTVLRQLATVDHQLQDLTSSSPPSRAGVGDGRDDVAVRRVALEQRRVFLQKAMQIEDEVCPLGMITMGSPIALFIFRKPSLLNRRNLWDEACPVAFQTDGFLGALRWRWQNFWHPSDPVAHRLEPLFNDGYPPAPSPARPGVKFVEDVKSWAWAREPLSAHSTYWTNPAVLRQISEQVADVLIALP